MREWLNAQAAGGYVDYHAVSDTYELTSEQAVVLADEDSPVFMPNAWHIPAAMWLDEEKAVHDFRTGRGISWATITSGSPAASAASIATPIERCSRVRRAAETPFNLILEVRR